MTNPILSRVEDDARNGYVGFRDTASTPQGGFQQTQTQGYGQAQGYGQTAPQPGYGHPQPGFPQQGGPVGGFGGDGGGGGRSVTLDDVLMKTGALFALLLAVAVPSWLLTPAIGPVLWGVGLVGTLGIMLFLMFKKTVSVPLIIAFTVFEGMFVGAISATYSNVFDSAAGGQTGSIFEGIVVQAVLATVCVFGAMLFLYRSGLVKVTQKFRAVVGMMTLGYFVFALINLGYMVFFDGSPFGFGGTGIVGIGISVFATGLAAVNLMLDFDSIDMAIRTGAPEKYSWQLAFGLMVTVVWLYLEILRLLARLRSE